MSHYPHLFSPLTINGMTIKNRIIMPPMGTNLASLNGEVTQEQIDYYELRARGGTGLITIENICIDFPFASNGTTQLRIDNDQYIPRLFKLTETLHKHGACVSIQLNHAGASAYAYRLNGEMPLSSSSTPSKKNGNIPRPMTHDEIYHAVDKFGDAAERVRRAGFDCVEIHAGHSYLISQFLSPLFNKRTDEFGGSVENRARILTLIVDKVRACVGPRFPVSLRISADDFLKVEIRSKTPCRSSNCVRKKWILSTSPPRKTTTSISRLTRCLWKMAGSAISLARYATNSTSPR